MKMLKIFSFLFIFCCITLGSYTYGQKSCKVLLPEIAKRYKGKCKKGLAHGKGVASGVDKFEGQFKKGLPHGFGTYKWEDGQMYEGYWKEGLRHGEGTLNFKVNDRDTLMAGMWEHDIYIGPKPENPYRLIRKTNIDRYMVSRIDDGDRVLFYFMQGGRVNEGLQQLSIVGDSGVEVSLGSALGHESIKFPYNCKVTYRTWNKLRTAQYDVTLEIEINQPGEWKIVLNN